MSEHFKKVTLRENNALTTFCLVSIILREHKTFQAYSVIDGNYCSFGEKEKSFRGIEDRDDGCRARNGACTKHLLRNVVFHLLFLSLTI